MVNVHIDHLFLLSVDFFRFGDDLDRAVRAIYLADPAAGAFMLIVFIVWHDDFPLESVEHHECLPVFGVFLCDDGFRGGEKILPRNGHPLDQGNDPQDDFLYIIEYTFHKLIFTVLMLPSC